MRKLHCIGIFSLIMTSAVAMQIPEDNIVTPRGMGDVKVSFDNEDFIVHNGSLKQVTQSCFNDPRLNNMDKAKLCALLKNGYIQVKPHGAGYRLEAHERLNGGGPWFGAFAFLGCTLVTAGAATISFVTLAPANPLADIKVAGGIVYGGLGTAVAAAGWATATPTP